MSADPSHEFLESLLEPEDNYYFLKAYNDSTFEDAFRLIEDEFRFIKDEPVKKDQSDNIESFLQQVLDYAHPVQAEFQEAAIKFPVSGNLVSQKYLFENEIDIQNAFQEEIWSVFGFIEFLIRGGRNSHYMLSNNAFSHLHKSRKIHVKIPAIPINAYVIATVECPTLPSNRAVFLSYSDKKNQQFRRSKILMNTNSNTLTDFSFYIHTDKPSMQQNPNSVKHACVFKMKIVYENGKEQTLHEFAFHLKKSHKYDSTEKGKIENLSNATRVKFKLE